MRKAKSEQDNKVKYGTVSLPLPLINTIKKKIEGTGMQSVSAYVTYVLRQILSSPDSGEVISKEEQIEVKKRLKTLGYD